MKWLGHLFFSGHAVDLVLIVMAVEFTYLALRPRLTGRPAPLVDLVLTFGPGVFILLALRAALTKADWIWIAAPLAASFPVHLADLVRRKL